jgi:hypothetical protein
LPCDATGAQIVPSGVVQSCGAGVVKSFHAHETQPATAQACELSPTPALFFPHAGSVPPAPALLEPPRPPASAPFAPADGPEPALPLAPAASELPPVPAVAASPPSVRSSEEVTDPHATRRHTQINKGRTR